VNPTYNLQAEAEEASVRAHEYQQHDERLAYIGDEHKVDDSGADATDRKARNIAAALQLAAETGNVEHLAKGGEGWARVDILAALDYMPWGVVQTLAMQLLAEVRRLQEKGEG